MLAVVTCLFDPVGYSRPLENYGRFASGLEVPLWTIELALGSSVFRLTPSPRLFQARSHSILWQKERLLNQVVRRLPPEVDKVVWADADILFEPGSFERIGEALEEYDVIQCFETAYRLTPEQSRYAEHDPSGSPLWPGDSVVKRILDGKSRQDAVFGFAWGAKRSFFDDIGLYERAVLGGGDTLLLDALFGGSPPDHLGDASSWFGLVKQGSFRVGYSSNRVCHLWHGSLKDRRYGDRHKILVRHRYDPSKDVRPEGWALEWATHKPCLHDEVRSYFLGRREDG